MKKKINKQRFYEQLTLVGVAVGLALIVWLMVKSSETRESSLDVPIEVVNVDPQIEVEVKPQQIQAVIRYGSESQAYINSDNFKFVINGSNLIKDMGISFKSVNISLTEKNWVTNTPVDLVKIGLQSASVEVKMRYNAIPAIIKPEIVGTEQIPEGYQLVSPVKVTPREVYLVGDSDKLVTLPKDDLTSRVLLKTLPVSVAGRTESDVESVEVQLPAGITMVQRSSNLVEVNLEIQEVQTVREIRNVPLEFLAVAPDDVDLRYNVKSSSVRVKGPQSLLKQLGSESFRVSLVRPPEEVPGTRLTLPLEVHFATSVPDELRNRITIQGIDPPTLPVEYVARDSASEEGTTSGTRQSGR